MRNIDGKFSTDGTRIFNTVSGADIPEDEPLFLLRARDVNAVAAMTAYLAHCRESQCKPDHIAGIQHAIVRFINFQVLNPSLVKQPGITGDFKLPENRCICKSGFGMNLSCPVHKP
jgi:hypothetical protein